MDGGQWGGESGGVGEKMKGVQIGSYRIGRGMLGANTGNGDPKGLTCMTMDMNIRRGIARGSVGGCWVEGGKRRNTGTTVIA